MAMQVLAKDGHHARIMQIRTPRGWELRLVEAEDRVAKYALLQSLANEVVALRGDALIDIAEAWEAPLEDILKGVLPESSPNRRETLVVAIATSDGKFRSHSTPFTRDESGNISFADTDTRDEPFPAYLAPFARAWGLPVPRPAEPFDAA